MASERNTVCDNNMIADHTIMPDMRIGHEQIIRTNNCFPCRHSAPVKGNTLPDNIPVAQIEIGLFSGKLEILRLIGKHSSRMNFTVTANPCP